MNVEYYAVVVLYNKKIQESLSINCLMNCKRHDLHIIVLDNSSDELVNINRSSNYALLVHYYPMEGNVGLSKAYNYALRLLENKNENDLVIWFDDDTFIERQYFEVLREKATEHQYDVFAPIIYGQDGIIYSPNEVGFLKGRYIKKPEQVIDRKKFNAINSCLAVRLKVYKEYFYDESLFMDCVDMKLFDDFRKMKVQFCILPVTIQQNFFQRSENKDVERYWERFQIRIKDTLIYSFNSDITHKISGLIRIYGWAVVYGMKLKSFWFFWNSVVKGTKLLISHIRIKSRCDNEN